MCSHFNQPPPPTPGPGVHGEGGAAAAGVGALPRSLHNQTKLVNKDKSQRKRRTCHSRIYPLPFSPGKKNAFWNLKENRDAENSRPLTQALPLGRPDHYRGRPPAKPHAGARAQQLQDVTLGGRSLPRGGGGDEADLWGRGGRGRCGRKTEESLGGGDGDRRGRGGRSCGQAHAHSTLMRLDSKKKNTTRPKHNSVCIAWERRSLPSG